MAYSCNAGKTITAAFYNGTTTHPGTDALPPLSDGTVKISLSDGRALTLGQIVSADGARYANPDGSFVFWSKGNGALVLENNVEKSYIGCVTVAPLPAGSNLTQVYSSGSDGFSIRLPQDYKVDESYKYQALGPGKDIAGVKFTISPSLVTGTNLSSDTYISVEEIPQTKTCTADLFLGKGATEKRYFEDGTLYSLASTSDAAAGNRYEETVYAFPTTNPCVAVRYFVHFGSIGNYPAGSVKQFDQAALQSQFDQIRRTVVVNQ